MICQTKYTNSIKMFKNDRFWKTINCLFRFLIEMNFEKHRESEARRAPTRAPRRCWELSATTPGGLAALRPRGARLDRHRPLSQETLLHRITTSEVNIVRARSAVLSAAIGSACTAAAPCRASPCSRQLRMFSAAVLTCSGVTKCVARFSRDRKGRTRRDGGREGEEIYRSFLPSRTDDAPGLSDVACSV